jgi:hypothetical protein
MQARPLPKHQDTNHDDHRDQPGGTDAAQCESAVRVPLGHQVAQRRTQRPGRMKAAENNSLRDMAVKKYPAGADGIPKMHCHRHGIAAGRPQRGRGDLDDPKSERDRGYLAPFDFGNTMDASYTPGDRPAAAYIAQCRCFDVSCRDFV